MVGKIDSLKNVTVAHTDGPIDVFKDLHTLDHKPLVRGGQGKMMLCPEIHKLCT